MADLCAEGLYVVTARVCERRPLLGTIEGNEEAATVRLSPLGGAVEAEIEALGSLHRLVAVCQHVVMPDHVHFILQLLGRVPRSFSAAAVADAWCHRCNEAAGLPSPLFDEGCAISPIASEGQYLRLARYIEDNPRRRIVEQAHAEWFTLRRGLEVGGHTFDAIGNTALLGRSMMAVRCHSRWSDEHLADYTRRCLIAARQGWVLVGAFISDAEAAIGIGAVEDGAAIIHLVRGGLANGYKPTINAFYTCAEGRLLHLSPFAPDEPRRLSRTKCQTLNSLAEQLAATNPE